MGADRDGLVRKAGGGRVVGISPKGLSKAGLEGRKRWVLPSAEVRQDPRWWRALSLSSRYPFGLPAKTIW